MLRTIQTRPVPRAFAIAMCLALCARQCALPVEKKDEVIAEFDIDSYWGIPRVPILFNGAAYHFLLDTGKAATRFEPELSPLLAKSGRRGAVIGPRGPMLVPLYDAPQGSLGGAIIPRLMGVWMIAEPMYGLLFRKVQGTLGADAMRGLMFRIDYDGAKISMLRYVGCDAGSRLQLIPQFGRPVVVGSIAGAEYNFVVDTCRFHYNTGVVGTRSFDRLIETGDLSVIDRSLETSYRGPVTRRDAVLKGRLTIAGFEHEGLVFSESNEISESANVLGIGFLRRYLVTFDFPGRAVYLKPSAEFRRIDASHDPGGVRLVRDGERIIASQVTASVSNAGVQAGDLLVAIDEVPTRGLSDIRLVELLSHSERPTALFFRRTADGHVTRFVHDEQQARRRVLDRLNSAKGAKR